MNKKLFIIGLILFISGIILFIVDAVLRIEQKPKTNIEKITVVTTLFPLYDFAKNIGGGKVDVFLLLPPGAEPHAFEPTPSDILKINTADVFIYTGKFMEPWAYDIIAGLDKRVKIVDSSVGIDLIEKEEHKYDEKYKKSSYKKDPHIWLDFTRAKIMAENIAKAFQKIDPNNTEYYQNNLKRYQVRLVDLDETYKKTLAVCESRYIIHGGHFAFGYLAKRYNLSHISAKGISPDAEPTAKDMIALVEKMKNYNINYLFYETLVSPRVAEAITRETGAQMLILNPAHNLTKTEYEAGVSFIDLMKKNLENLSRGLNCL